MYDRIVRNSGLALDGERRLEVVAAALLHDIGHGPFSHSIEEALNSLHSDDESPDDEPWFHHEKMTERIILEDDEVSKLLSAVDPNLPKTVAAYINKKLRNSDHWTYRVVSSQLDADRIDYLLRDARNAGLLGHGFDLPRLLDMLYAEGDRVVVDSHATEALEAFLLMLQHAYRAIYFHRGVRGATVLLVSVLKRAAHLYRDGSM